MIPNDLWKKFIAPPPVDLQDLFEQFDFWPEDEGADEFIAARRLEREKASLQSELWYKKISEQIT